jgi:hypothetical protein
MSPTTGKNAKSSVKMSKDKAKVQAKAEAQAVGKENNSSVKMSKEEAKANAKTDVKTAGKENEPKAELKGESSDIEKQLKNYESKVSECVSLFKKIEKDGASKSLTKEFEKTLSQAEDMKNKLEGAKEQMNRTQTDRFSKANSDLSQVYIKK